jgi:DNA-binding GntR family transcriptional regulator
MGDTETRRVGETHQTLRALACDQIRDWIVTGRFPPGTRLVEGALAQELGVSRIPVREALKQLDAEGFVDIVPRRGAVVAQLSMKDAEDFYEVRSALESFSARLAAERRKPADVEELQRIITAGRRAVRRRQWDELTRLNNAFHEAVAVASGNAHLVELMTSYGVRMAWIFSSSAQRRGAAAWDEHAAIADAIAEGDPERAEALGMRHIVHSRDVYTASRTS